MKRNTKDVQIVGVGANRETVEDMSVLEEAGIAYDPTKATLDLDKSEKLRVTALVLAIQAYDKLIIKDAEMYNAISMNASRGNGGPVIQPATMNAMVEAAINFEHFLRGHFSKPAQAPRADSTGAEEGNSENVE